MLLTALLGGCQGGGVIGTGRDLFHDLQGGRIADQRPPPPGVNDPYPNLGSIPKRPDAPDITGQQRIADQLASQRDQAEQAAAANPLTPRAPPPAPPKPAAAPDPNANRVVVDAAPAPPPPKPAAAPVATTPAAPTPPGPAIPTLASVPAVAPPVASGPLPTFAAAPPPGPTGLGTIATPVAAATATVSAPAASVAPAPPPAATPAAAPKSFLETITSATPVPGPVGDTIVKTVAPPATSSVTVSFTAGSAQLPPSAPLDLRRFALSHKGVPVTVTGHGEAVLPGADSQSRALDLALRRAQAIAAALGTAGIPAANLRLRAEASGRGGLASL